MNNDNDVSTPVWNMKPDPQMLKHITKEAKGYHPIMTQMTFFTSVLSYSHNK